MRGKIFLKVVSLHQELPSLGGTWVTQSVKHLTLDFRSGHGLTVHEFEPGIRLCADSVVPAWDSLSPFISVLPSLVLSRSLKINK